MHVSGVIIHGCKIAAAFILVLGLCGCGAINTQENEDLPNMMSDECKVIVDFLNCEYELFSDTDELVSRLGILSKQGEREGFFPLIIIPSEALAQMIDFALTDYAIEPTPKGMEAYCNKVLEQAKEINAERLLLEKFNEYQEPYKGFDLIGDFVQAEPQTELALYSFQGEAILAKIPAQNPWELAAWLPMGGFNDCPSPNEQAAIFRYWHEKYGAVPVVATHDIWQMQVSKPPESDEAALALAKEHFAFCTDIVTQGAQSISALASGLKHSELWYFWWD